MGPARRRMTKACCRLLGMVICPAVLAPSFAQDNDQLPAHWASEFTNSVGLNIHVTQPDTFYVTHFAEVKARLIDLGVRHFRDGAVDDRGDVTDRDQSALFRQLGQAGMRGDFIFNVGVSRHLVTTFPLRVAPAFEAYELPNEFNLNGGPDWAAKLRGWMPHFREYVRAANTGVPYSIIGPSLVSGYPDPFAALGNHQDDFDLGNMHVYFNEHNPGTRGWGDVGPVPCESFNYGSIGYTACLTSQVSGDRPTVITETGWSSDSNDPGGIPPALQSRYIARMLLLAFNRNIRRTYIYQLVDSGGDIGQHNGLLTDLGSEKPSFRYLRALLKLTADREGAGDPGSMTIHIDGDSEHVEKTLLRKTDGSFLLILWIEQPASNSGANETGREITLVTPRTVTLTLSGFARAIEYLRPDGNLDTEHPSSLESGTTSRMTLTLNDSLTIVHIAQIPH